ncbi:hypothetical protein [Sulfitobacter mediterraneus]|uniref:Uncharacterized protein n=1 Tax=Sulfitobacter mediterraneus TaxID=83219 RepID=A0A061SV94_9RHOB|nr:hypothetical protein [Sulfitobacter mediterraneus]KAJ03310.1 hypothetical protein PM02_10425 [Sulfitobacter mediterraneus]
MPNTTDIQPQDETRVQYLERNIAEVAEQRRVLQNAPLGVSISENDAELAAMEKVMRAELDKLRPYSVAENGSKFVVAHNGMFITDESGDKFLSFDTVKQAEAWIDEVVSGQIGVAA